jgi:hypothetical protein
VTVVLPLADTDTRVTEGNGVGEGLGFEEGVDFGVALGLDVIDGLGDAPLGVGVTNTTRDTTWSVCWARHVLPQQIFTRWSPNPMSRGTVIVSPT